MGGGGSSGAVHPGVCGPIGFNRLGFTEPTGEARRPTYAAELQLKIGLQGYLQRIGSTPKLEAACREHLSLLWLAALLQPDHNTRWRFWQKHQMTLPAVFKQTVQVAVRSGCAGLTVQALDGTKLAAACAGRTDRTKAHTEKLCRVLDEALAKTELEIVQEHAAATGPGYRLPAGLAQREALSAEIKAGLSQLETDGRSHYHPKEPTARRMETGMANRPAYNAQAMTDDRVGIILVADLTREETDGGELVPMIAQTHANVGVAGRRWSARPAICASSSGTGARGSLRPRRRPAPGRARLSVQEIVLGQSPRPRPCENRS
jgi:transposase